MMVLQVVLARRFKQLIPFVVVVLFFWLSLLFHFHDAFTSTSSSQTTLYKYHPLRQQQQQQHTITQVVVSRHYNNNDNIRQNTKTSLFLLPYNNKQQLQEPIIQPISRCCTYDSSSPKFSRRICRPTSSNSKYGTTRSSTQLQLLTRNGEIGGLQQHRMIVTPTTTDSRNTFPISDIMIRMRQQSTNTKKHFIISKRSTKSISLHSTAVVGSMMIPSTTTTFITNPTVVTISLVLIHIIGGLLGTPFVAAATNKEYGWYNQISLPKWTPPNRIFPIVWTYLYGTMGYAVARIIYATSTTTAIKTPLLALWVMHYLLNLSWAPIFFGQQNLKLGLGINYMLLVTLGIGLVRPFYRIQPIAGILLVPYLLWLMYATILNDVICQLNPTASEGNYNNAKFYKDLNTLQQKAKEYADS